MPLHNEGLPVNSASLRRKQSIDSIPYLSDRYEDGALPYAGPIHVAHRNPVGSLIDHPKAP